MPSLSYKKAMEKGLITPKEIERFAVAALCSFESFKPDLDACATESSTSKASFGVMYNGTIRKLKAAGCYIGEGDDCDAISTPATPASKKVGEKRKAKDTGDGNTPASSGRKRGTKAAKTVAAEEAEDDDLLSEPVKAEPEGDFSS